MAKTDEELKVREFVRPKPNGGDMTVMATVIENCFGMGWMKKDVAALLGIDTDTLRVHIQSSEILGKAYMDGRDTATKAVVAQTFRTAMGGYTYQEITERTLPGGGIEKTVVTKTAPPNWRMQIFWLTNRDPEHWKHIKHMKSEETKTHKYELPEADKIAELGRGILGDGSSRPEAEPIIPPVFTRPTGSGQSNAEGFHSPVHSETNNSVQNDVLDVPAQKGTEPL